MKQVKWRDWNKIIKRELLLHQMKIKKKNSLFGTTITLKPFNLHTPLHLILYPLYVSIFLGMPVASPKRLFQWQELQQQRSAIFCNSEKKTNFKLAPPADAQDTREKTPDQSWNLSLLISGPIQQPSFCEIAFNKLSPSRGQRCS